MDQTDSHIYQDGGTWCPRDGGWHPTVTRIYEDERREICTECGKEVA